MLLNVLCLLSVHVRTNISRCLFMPSDTGNGAHSIGENTINFLKMGIFCQCIGK